MNIEAGLNYLADRNQAALLIDDLPPVFLTSNLQDIITSITEEPGPGRVILYHNGYLKKPLWKIYYAILAPKVISFWEQEFTDPWNLGNLSLKSIDIVKRGELYEIRAGLKGLIGYRLLARVK